MTLITEPRVLWSVDFRETFGNVAPSTASTANAYAFARSGLIPRFDLKYRSSERSLFVGRPAHHCGCFVAGDDGLGIIAMTALQPMSALGWNSATRTAFRLPTVGMTSFRGMWSPFLRSWGCSTRYRRDRLARHQHHLKSSQYQ